MKQKLREERGITLVALIITIIVLIILAAVTINAAFKSNFIEMATNGTANYANAQSYEQRAMDDLSDKLYGVINKISNIQSGGSAESELENFTKDPDAYKHPDQSETNKDRGVGTDGKPVNMDLWKYVIRDEGKKEVSLGNIVGYNVQPGYIGNIVEGKIQGTVPQYIKVDGKEGIYTVTGMYYTFNDCTTLTTAPKIPGTVTDMNNTFNGCSSLVNAPEIPNGVTSMGATFYGCNSLEEAPKIPSSVKYMNRTFYSCSSLVNAPEIPNSVTNMSSTFWGCESLAEAPEIPNGVTNMSYTFSGCGSLVKASEIPNSVTNMQNTFSYCTSLVNAPEISSNVTNMNDTFKACTSLVNAPEIPNSVKSMEDTFSFCHNLKGNIKINSNDVENVSGWSSNWNITIQVPAGSTTYEKVNQAYGSNANVTIETF